MFHCQDEEWCGVVDVEVIVVAGYAFRGDPGGAAVDDYYGDVGGSVNMTSLSVYLSVLGASTALALYYLLVHPSTRLVRRRADLRAP